MRKTSIGELDSECQLALGTTSPSSDPTQKASTGALNPEFVCWLMGFPPEWLNFAPSATPSRPRSRRNS